MNTYALILDAIVIVIAVFMIISSAKKGFLRSAIMLGGYIASVFAAIYLSNFLSGVIYKNFIRQSMIDNINRTISRSSVGESFHNVLTNIFVKMPNLLSKMVLSSYGGKQNIETTMRDYTGGTVSKLSTMVTDNMVGPTLTFILQIVLCLLIFAICVIIVKAIASLFKGFNEIPILGGVNRLLGAVVGVLKACIILYLIALAVSLTILLSSNHLTWLNTNIVNQSFVFKNFYKLTAQ